LFAVHLLRWITLVQGIADNLRCSAGGLNMAEHGEWNRKGAVLSDVTAKKEYGVTREFIVQGIRAGKLEYRQGVIWGNPYLRILRSQLEEYIAERQGPNQLESKKAQTELRKIKREIASLKKRMAALQARQDELEAEVQAMPAAG
jgi:hypothetical protein